MMIMMYADWIPMSCAIIGMILCSFGTLLMLATDAHNAEKDPEPRYDTYSYNYYTSREATDEELLAECRRRHLIKDEDIIPKSEQEESFLYRYSAIIIILSVCIGLALALPSIIIMIKQ